MPASMIDQVGRIVTLHNALAADRAVDGGGVSTSLLLEDMRCKRKALYGCVEDLRNLGAPVTYDRKQHVWSYEKTWNFPWHVIHTLSGPAGLRLTMALLMDPDLEVVLEDLVVVDSKLPRRGSATLPRMTGKVEHDVLGRISTALREHCRMRFLYRKPSNAVPEPREVEPLSIFEWDGMPYLQARDPNDPAHQFKRFALARMSRPEVLEVRFDPPPSRRIPTSLGAFTGPQFLAVIRAEPHLAPYVQERSWHREQKNRPMKDGSIVFKLPFGDHEEAARWILGRGPGFVPQAPSQLVISWKRMVKAIASDARAANLGPIPVMRAFH